MQGVTKLERVLQYIFRKCDNILLQSVIDRLLQHMTNIYWKISVKHVGKCEIFLLHNTIFITKCSAKLLYNMMTHKLDTS